MLTRAGMAIEVRRDSMPFQVEDGSFIDTPIVKPSSWLRIILKKYKSLLFPHGNLEQELNSFWKCFEYIQPGHVVFQSPSSRERLNKTLPILLHGDEGRYLKKGNYMIATIECMLGSTPTKCRPCSCSADPALQRYEGLDDCCQHGWPSEQLLDIASKQYVNLSGNCFLSKFMLFGMKSQIYKSNPDLVHATFDLVSKDLELLHNRGIEVGPDTFYAAVLGIKGDMKFHYQIGNLSRSYYNVGVKENHPICALCMAGAPDIPFEDLAEGAAWEATIHTNKPWPESEPPAVTQIPFEPGAEESIFRLDTFHCWKLGVGRDLVGSSLIFVALAGYFDSPGDAVNLPDRLERCFSSFRLHCMANGKTPAVHYFSQALFNASNQRSFPWANCKGSDVTLLTSWLLFIVKLLMQSGDVQHEHVRYFAILRETLESTEQFFDVLYSHGLWLPRICGRRVLHHLNVMLKGYKLLAQEVKKLNVVAYSLKPKLHAMRHIAREISRQLEIQSPRILNVLAFSCEPNEDMVGHVARLSRRVSARTVNNRVLDRVCIKMKTLWSKKRKRSEL